MATAPEPDLICDGPTPEDLWKLIVATVDLCLTEWFGGAGYIRKNKLRRAVVESFNKEWKNLRHRPPKEWSREVVSEVAFHLMPGVKGSDDLRCDMVEAFDHSATPLGSYGTGECECSCDSE